MTVALLTVGLVGTIGGVAFLDRSDRSGQGQADREAPTTAALPSAPSTSAFPPTSSLTTQGTGPEAASVPGRSYITIGTNEARQFTDAEYRMIASGYDVVVFTKGHAGWDVTLHHEATRRLKELNPDVRVYAYISTKFWFDRNDWGVEIDPSWFLRDRNGELIPKIDDGGERDTARYVDLADPAYRAWVLGVAQSWMRAAPYDGVRFDAADPVGDYGKHEIARWSKWLEPDRIAAYNDGIVDLLRSADRVLPSVLFNGISPSDIRGPDRGLSMLSYTDGAMNESFCITTHGELHDVVEDIAIMHRFPTKSLQLRARYDPAEVAGEDLRRLQRLCVGSFLMGWQPGATYFNMGTNYGVDQLSQQPPELALDLGLPTGPAVQEGHLLQREYARGVVYVNLSLGATTVTVPAGMVRAADDGMHAVTGTTEKIGAQDGAFFLSRSG